MNNAAILHYTGQLQKYMTGDVWVDETFDKKLAAIPESDVFTRPLPGIHSVAEIISHLLEWRLCVIDVLRGGVCTLKLGSPANWRSNNELSSVGWQSLIAAFKKSQQEIIDILQPKSDDFLQLLDNKQRYNYQYYLDGLLQHDMYHLGQLGLIIKLLKERS